MANEDDATIAADGEHALSSTSESQDTVASMSLHFPDCLRLILFPDGIVDIVRATIIEAWEPGIKSERDQSRALEFQLKSYPWIDSNSVHAVRLLSRLLEALSKASWVQIVTTAMSSTIVNLDQMFFERQVTPPAPQHWMHMHLGGFETVYFADAPGDLLATMVAALAGETQIHGPWAGNCYKFKFRGRPWWGRSPKDHTAATLRLLTILETLRRGGWTVHTNIDARLQRRKETEPRRPDAWICCRPADWDPSKSFNLGLRG